MYKMYYKNTLQFAREQDANDILKDFRNYFYIPLINGKECIYFAGNSLGLQPKSTQNIILNELENWANFGVEGHFYIKDPWYSYHDFFPKKLSKIMGCKPHEIVVMNQLTVNIHLLMASFYKPTAKKYKLICEAKAFPSDQYAMASQVLFHGFDPEKSIIEIAPRQGEHEVRTEDIISVIKQHEHELAILFFGGINYYSGQVFDIRAITKAAHEANVLCGFDLAHAAGNVELKLHEWDVDFACWCSYKYLNAGPGSIAGAFIHERFATDTAWPRLTGWWGNNKETRFKMEKEFKPISTAEGWQVSNPSILDMAAHKAALTIFDEAGFDNLLIKSKKTTGFTLFILQQFNEAAGREIIKILTPLNEEKRGCQVSMLINDNGKLIFDTLKANGVIGDWREPNVIRIAPVPLYNSFEDVFRFGDILSSVFKELKLIPVK
jgi:kynureninase